jgi:hypothetical protein
MALYARDIFSQYLRTGAKRQISLDAGLSALAHKRMTAGDWSQGAIIFDDAQAQALSRLVPVFLSFQASANSSP